MRSIIITALGFLIPGILMSGCKNPAAKQETVDCEIAQAIKPVAIFNADSAFSYVKRQVDFGPRIPGTASHDNCATYIVNELKRHGADEVLEQITETEVFTGEKLPVHNILGRINPDSSKRILFVAHYDTRPWADSEEDTELHNTPIPGANDGGSGVAVMLEMVRQLAQKRPQIGVDLLFVDVEDYGQSSGFGNHDDTWCLGSQKWVKEMPYSDENRPSYGIVLDMVGGLNARFNKEYFSNKYAPEIVTKVWVVARRSGYGDIFPTENGGVIIDDHVVLNQAGIPTIDVIESKNIETRSFPPTWHTLDDNLQNIDPASLKAVGQTMLNLIFTDKL